MSKSYYDPVLSAKAWEMLSGLPRRRQERLSKLIYKLADYPFQLGDHQSRDSVGRPLESLRVEGYILTYWADHGAKELRILDITDL